MRTAPIGVILYCSSRIHTCLILPTPLSRHKPAVHIFSHLGILNEDQPLEGIMCFYIAMSKARYVLPIGSTTNITAVAMFWWPVTAWNGEMSWRSGHIYLWLPFVNPAETCFSRTLYSHKLVRGGGRRRGGGGGGGEEGEEEEEEEEAGAYNLAKIIRPYETMKDNLLLRQDPPPPPHLLRLIQSSLVVAP